jgi:hypothetical protein
MPRLALWGSALATSRRLKWAERWTENPRVAGSVGPGRKSPKLLQDKKNGIPFR